MKNKNLSLKLELPGFILEVFLFIMAGYYIHLNMLYAFLYFAMGMLMAGIVGNIILLRGRIDGFAKGLKVLKAVKKVGNVAVFNKK